MQLSDTNVSKPLTMNNQPKQISNAQELLQVLEECVMLRETTYGAFNMTSTAPLLPTPLLDRACAAIAFAKGVALDRVPRAPDRRNLHVLGA